MHLSNISNKLVQYFTYVLPFVSMHVFVKANVIEIIVWYNKVQNHLREMWDIYFFKLFWFINFDIYALNSTTSECGEIIYAVKCEISAHDRNIETNALVSILGMWRIRLLRETSLLNWEKGLSLIDRSKIETHSYTDILICVNSMYIDTRTWLRIIYLRAMIILYLLGDNELSFRRYSRGMTLTTGQKQWVIDLNV